MIDTIVLRIHNLKKYARLADSLYTRRKGAITEAYADEETGELLEKSFLNSLIYHDSGILVRSRHRATYHIASSHYDVSYLVDFAKDFIDVNFSIPKAKYSTNVFQFIDYYDQGSTACFRLLLEYIRYFVTQFSKIDKVDDEDIEINRIDLCYNQFFVSKEDALRYLDHQKDLIVSYSRGLFTKPVDYGFGIAYRTDRYNFKIYHKGTEFEKNDLRELRKNNPLSLDLLTMQHRADTVLRYEVTYRNSFINYAFERLYIAGESNEPTVYRYLYGALRLDGFRGEGKLMRKKFFLRSEYDNWRLVKKELGRDWPKVYKGNDQVTFNLEIFDYLFRHFWDYARRFQLETSFSIDVIKGKIAQLSEEARVQKQLTRGRSSERNEKRIMFYALLSQSINLKEYYKKGYLSEAQFYRVKKDLARLGLKEFNPELNLPRPTLDYQSYKYYFGLYH